MYTHNSLCYLHKFKHLPLFNHHNHIHSSCQVPLRRPEPHAWDRFHLCLFLPPVCALKIPYQIMIWLQYVHNVHTRETVAVTNARLSTASTFHVPLIPIFIHSRRARTLSDTTYRITKTHPDARTWGKNKKLRQQTDTNRTSTHRRRPRRPCAHVLICVYAPERHSDAEKLHVYIYATSPPPPHLPTAQAAPAPECHLTVAVFIPPIKLIYANKSRGKRFAICLVYPGAARWHSIRRGARVRAVGVRESRGVLKGGIVVKFSAVVGLIELYLYLQMVFITSIWNSSPKMTENNKLAAAFFSDAFLRVYCCLKTILNLYKLKK